MKIFTAEEVAEKLSYPEFIDSLQETFAGKYTMPPRQVMKLDPDGGNDAFAMLPAWNDKVIALKSFTYFPENAPPYSSLYSKIIVFDRQHGEPKAIVDGTSVTLWRTAGVSALASRYLSREDSSTLLILGTGKLAPYLMKAHASVRPIKKILIWGRNEDKARNLAKAYGKQLEGINISSVESIETACEIADIVVCATGSHDILLDGDWIKDGTHVDCLGNHHADKRECDTETVINSRVFVDTKVNCFKEAGELIVPVVEGKFSLDDVEGELSDLCRGDAKGRQSADEKTFFKSVGCALGDMAGAMAVIE